MMHLHDDWLILVLDSSIIIVNPRCCFWLSVMCDYCTHQLKKETKEVRDCYCPQTQLVAFYTRLTYVLYTAIPPQRDHHQSKERCLKSILWLLVARTATLYVTCHCRTFLWVRKLPRLCAPLNYMSKRRPKRAASLVLCHPIVLSCRHDISHRTNMAFNFWYSYGHFYVGGA